MIRNISYQISLRNISDSWFRGNLTATRNSIQAATNLFLLAMNYEL